MTGEEVVLIIGAIGLFITGPVMTVWARFDAKRTEAAKEAKYAAERAEREAKAEAGRTEARETLTAVLGNIERKQDEVHVLVDGRSTKQDAKIDAQSARIEDLNAVLSGTKKKPR